jgi:hypothetical protein
MEGGDGCTTANTLKTQECFWDDKVNGFHVNQILSRFTKTTENIMGTPQALVRTWYPGRTLLGQASHAKATAGKICRPHTTAHLPPSQQFHPGFSHRGTRQSLRSLCKNLLAALLLELRHEKTAGAGHTQGRKGPRTLCVMEPLMCSTVYLRHDTRH